MSLSFIFSPVVARLILKIYLATVARLSTTFVRVSHDFPANVTYFHLNLYDSPATFMRVSRDICTNVVRMSLSFIFSPDSREVFARLSRDRRATLARHLYECHENFAL